jgi:hypothetical protein
MQLPGGQDGFRTTDPADLAALALGPELRARETTRALRDANTDPERKVAERTATIAVTDARKELEARAIAADRMAVIAR